MITMSFINEEVCEYSKREQVGFLENKRKRCLDDMDGISV
jgi:hypothetical protein